MSPRLPDIEKIAFSLGLLFFAFVFCGQRLHASEPNDLGVKCIADDGRYVDLVLRNGSLQLRRNFYELLNFSSKIHGSSGPGIYRPFYRRASCISDIDCDRPGLRRLIVESGGSELSAAGAAKDIRFASSSRAGRIYESLSEKQNRFSLLVARLIQQAALMGYQVSLGEAWRSQEQSSFRVKLNADKGIGIAQSLHRQRLAIDINLFQLGKFLTTTAEYRPLGEWWEKQCDDCMWGGRFKRADGNHFSIEHQGVR